MKKIVTAIIIIGILVISALIIKNKCSNSEADVAHKEYGDILDYSIDGNWEEYLYYKEIDENAVEYTFTRWIDYCNFCQRFNEFLKNNPTYYLNNGVKITAVFMDKLKSETFVGLIIKNYEAQINDTRNKLYVVVVGEWYTVPASICTDLNNSGIECIEVDEVTLGQYYKDILFRFPSATKIRTSAGEYTISLVKEYSKEIGREITIDNSL